MPFYLSRAQNVDSLEVRAMMLFSVAHVKGNPTNTLNYETVDSKMHRNRGHLKMHMSAPYRPPFYFSFEKLLLN